MAQSYFRSLLAMMRKPYYSAVPLFPAAQDLSWIPDAGTNIATEYAAEAPLGRVTTNYTTTFTFVSQPKYIVYNSALLKAGIDFTLNGSIVTMLVATLAGEELYAVV